MKIRKRMGLPTVRVAPPHRRRDAGRQSVPDDIVEMLRDQARRTIIREHELAAKQRRLLERAAADAHAASEGPSKQSAEDAATTPDKFVALLNRIAETEVAFTPEQREMARKLGF